MPYQTKLTTVAEADLAAMDQRTRKAVIRKIAGLRDNPEQGKPLLGELKGLRSLTALRRWRIIYTIQHHKIRVLVLAMGMRRQGSPDDVYEIAKILRRRFAQKEGR